MLLALCLAWTLTQDPARLIESLGDADPVVRDAAAESLVKAGKAAIPLLAPLVDKPDLEIAGRAGSILRKIGTPAMLALAESSSEKLRSISRGIVRDLAEPYLRPGGSYRVEWKDPAVLEPSRELVLGSGSGHGSMLTWQRLRPKDDGVEILSIEFRGNRKPYQTKWGPDAGQAVLQRSSLAKDDYAALLAVIGMIRAASIVEVSTNHFFSTSGDFYVFVQAPEPRDRGYLAEYAGYQGTSGERRYAKPTAIERCVRDVLKKVEWTRGEPTAEDRAWVGRKFVDDWTRINQIEEKGYWWVQESALQLVGLAGDASALPVLTEIIRDGKADDRKTYYAINAATRLCGTDVRDKPVETMDIDATRAKLLPLLEKK